MHTTSKEVKKLSEEFFINLLDSMTLGICLDVHRAIKIGTFHKKDIKLYNGCFNNHNSPIIPQNSIFNLPIQNTNSFDVIKNYQCKCMNCNRNITAVRFAPHLEKCLGMGRNSSRLASKKIKKYVENAFSNDECYENFVNENFSDLNEYENPFSNKTDDSSVSTLSNRSNKLSSRKNYKRKKMTNYVLTDEFISSSLGLNFTQLPSSIPKSGISLISKPFVMVTKILPTNELATNLLKTSQHVSKILKQPKQMYCIKNVSEIEVGDIAVLKLSFLLSHNLVSNKTLDLLPNTKLEPKSSKTMNYLLSKWIGEVSKLTYAVKKETSLLLGKEENINLKWLDIISDQPHFGESQTNNLLKNLSQTTFYRLIECDTQPLASKLRNEKYVIKSDPPQSTYDINKNAIALLIKYDISQALPDDLMRFLEHSSINS